MTINELLEKFRNSAGENKRKQGTIFEKFVKQYLTQSKDYQNFYEKIWLWNDFPYKDGHDTGIDLVAKHRNEDKYTAIQCKFYDNNATIYKKDIDSFLSCSNKVYEKVGGGELRFSQCIIVTTASKWGDNVLSTIDKYAIPTKRIDFYDFINDNDIDWSSFIDENNFQIKHQAKQLRPHQKEAIDNIIDKFKTSDRGKLIMACGTGKTFTSLKLAETYGAGKIILFLAPSISLISQTIKEWLTETSINIGCIPVCSDTSVGKKEEDSLSSALSEFQYTASTNENDFIERYNSIPNTAMKVVFSTYQSINVIHNAQAKCGFVFDLIICDEAHRTTGAKLSNQDDSNFIKIHDNDYIKGNKRLYMTATPRVYGESVKKKAEETNAILCSMDDETIYGEEFYRLGFGKAVEEGLLTDYKVIVLSVNESYVYKNFRNVDMEELDDYGKIIGIWNALSKHNILDVTSYTEINDPNPMKRAVAFTGTIKDSLKLKEMVEESHNKYNYKENNLVKINIEHIDGKMPNITRNKLINGLKQEPEENTCNILTNARCLSEGIDVPSLDGVIFLAPKNSMVDIVQSIGRVMRKSEDKKYGYIILPIVVPDNEDPNTILEDHAKYRIIWNVLQAIRSHDDRFDSVINSLNYNKGKQNTIIVGQVGFSSSGDTQITTHFIEHEYAFHEGFENALYNKIVQKCGDKIYWEKWASEVTDLAKLHIKTIKELLEEKTITRNSFNIFLKILRKNINNNITEDDAIEMISQHLITKPIFEALFSTYSFVNNNPVSKAIQDMLENIDDGRLVKGSNKLNNFYESVRKKVSTIHTFEEKQKIIVELYDKFFRLAFKDVTDKLGIVYTPTEAVDFIIKSVEYALNKHFNKSISEKGINIIDPFTGTGTFITRLIQSGLINEEDLEYKYKHEIHANEIILLAYYIAAINIEETYHKQSNKTEYTSFEGIILTDTFQLSENKNTIIEADDTLFLHENSERVLKQKNAPIKVIIGNPPYSKGQKSENDNNKNTSYPLLEKSIADTYVKETNNNNKNSLYNSYVKAIRWSTDRLDNEGIICFITNSGYIDSKSFSGFRKVISKEFSHIYCFDLKGNIRKTNANEGENIFGNACGTGIAILLLVKENIKKENNSAKIYYGAIGDKLKTKEKLLFLKDKSFEDISLTEIIPDNNNDWINQRNDSFNKYTLIGKKSKNNNVIFTIYSGGVKTNRSAWSYNYSRSELSKNIISMINYYNMECVKYQQGLINENELNNDSTQIKWSGLLKDYLKRGKNIVYKGEFIVKALFRPFSKKCFYYDKHLIERTYQMLNLFPTDKYENILILVNGLGARKEFMPFIASNICDYAIYEAGTQCFPLYYYVKYDTNNPIEMISNEVDENGYKKEYAVSDYALKEYQKRYGNEVTQEDIFYYIYGLLHNEEYRTMYLIDLKKSLPRIPYVKNKDDFFQYVKAGKELANIHLNYETIEPYELKEERSGNENYLVTKMKFINDKKSLIYNDYITFTNIPQEIFNYKISGRSPLEWVVSQYQISEDKESKIKNNPNEYSEDEKYIYNLVKRVVNVSIKTLEIIKNLPKYDVE